MNYQLRKKVQFASTGHENLRTLPQVFVSYWNNFVFDAQEHCSRSDMSKYVLKNSPTVLGINKIAFVDCTRSEVYDLNGENDINIFGYINVERVK